MTALNQTVAMVVPALWDDISTLSPSGVNPTGPDGSATIIIDPTGYVGFLQFDAVGESSTAVFQLNHRYMLGTDLHPHIHVVRNDATDNTGNAEFEANFRVLPLRGTASAWTGYIAGTTTLQPADGVNQTGLITWSLANSTYNFGISDQIAMIIRRSGLTTGSVAIGSHDIHGQHAQNGSPYEGSL